MPEADTAGGDRKRWRLTQDVEDRLVEAFEQGATTKLACLYGGISRDTLAEWLKAAAAGDERCQRLAERVRRAEGARAVVWLRLIQASAAAGEWRALAWLMERLYPDEYGRRVLEHRFPTRAEVEEAARAAARREGVDEDEVVRRALAVVEGGAARWRKSETGSSSSGRGTMASGTSRPRRSARSRRGLGPATPRCTRSAGPAA